MQYVIVGGGIAGVTAAEELRKLDSDAEITLVAGEQHALYSRVLLPHYIKGKIPRERVFLKKETWYADQRIEWLPGIFVEKLDANNKFVLLSDGRELSYDKLLVATGGDLRVLPEDVRGVSYFRTLDDADHLVQLLSEPQDDARVGIYGGGFIACEYLNIFAHFQRPTTIAFRGPYFWSSVLSPELGTYINDHLRAQGVEVIPEAGFVGVKGERVLSGFVTTKGEVSCSLLGVGIGIELEDTWMREATLKTGSGILCDEFLQTNLPDVYTAGDVAHFFDPLVGTHVAVGNWMNAQMQGRTVAKTLSGTKTAFQLVSSYSTNALGMEMIFIGTVSREQAEQTRVIGTPEEGMGEWFIKDGRLIGAVLLNRNTDRAEVTKLIQSREPVVEKLWIT